jgi:hypothetical protein
MLFLRAVPLYVSAEIHTALCPQLAISHSMLGSDGCSDYEQHLLCAAMVSPACPDAY